MNMRPTMLVFVLAAGTAFAQKAEPNKQVPATPQANSGEPSGASASTIQRPELENSATLRSQIENALSNEPSLSGSHVSVNVTDNEIQLSGTAASPKDKLTAERIAQSFDGNRKFTDNLLVTGQAGAPNPATNKSAAPKHP